MMLWRVFTIIQVVSTMMPIVVRQVQTTKVAMLSLLLAMARIQRWATTGSWEIRGARAGAKRATFWWPEIEETSAA